MSWTKQQEKVITLRGGNLLVSAAAGSGKTAVLVERILEKITDPEHPVDIDRILVVTFTKAAAAQMRERIADCLSERREKNPEDANLKRQASLLGNAKISTIDSFCQSVIRNQFSRISLEPSFRVGDEGEMKVMRQDVLDRLFEARYAAEDPALLRLSEHFSTDRSDDRLKEIILQIYEYAMSAPWPDRWLDGCRRMYHPEEKDADADRLSSDWMQALTENLCAQISGIADAYEPLIAQVLSPGGPYMYENALKSDREQLREAARRTDFSALREQMLSFEKKKLDACRDKTVDLCKKEQVQKMRNRLTDQIRELQTTYFAQAPEQLQTQMKQSAADADALCDLTAAFRDAFAAEKRSENILDFSDLEHFALQILVDEETGRPTAAALEYQDFFEEIMIDEYQDSNDVQELVLMSISRQEGEHPNVFMVGDVKQSIYGFRLAKPELFLEKYRTYEDAMEASADTGGLRKARIELHRNFRSRPEVLAGVNAVFERLMRPDIGGIDYNDDAALYAGRTPGPEDNCASYRTELWLTDAGIDAEAALITQRIREMTDPQKPFLITDTVNGTLRPVSCRDIVILMRSLGEKADRMAQHLNDAGIPAHVQSKTGYFSSLEVRTILSFLRIIDNPRQDIPLAAVLKSPIYGLTADDLAKIRIISRKTDFYDALVRYAAQGEDEELRGVLADFLEDLSDYRMQSRLLEIHELLAYLLRRSGYDKIVSAMPGGEQRLLNIRMLEERAAAFEKTSFHGLFQFNRYLEQMETYQVDYGEASAVGENADAVRIISIHKSKGLEYPVVFISALGSQFNRQDLARPVQLHARLGIGIDVFYRDRRTKTPTMLKKAIRLMNETESMGEEMRVLYVGMTRAREKLILTAASDKAAEWEETLQTPDSQRNAISFYKRMKAGCFMDWICEALAGRNDVCDVRYVPADALAQQDAREVLSHRQWYAHLKHQIAKADPQRTDFFRTRFAASSAAPPRELAAKVSVSELKIDRIRENGEDPEELFADTHRRTYVPSFEREQADDLTGASYGTAVHRVMECLDFAAAADALREGTDAAHTADAALRAMCEDGVISEQIANVVSRRAFCAFLKSRLFARMAQADRCGRLIKERPFVMRVSAQEVQADAPDSETVLVQGIIDAYFEENGSIVLVDYKTDRVNSPMQLTERYRRQMELYAAALSGGTGKEVKEMLLYSFYMDTAVEISR